MTDDPAAVAKAYYDELAPFYTEIADSPIRRLVTWPATKALLPDREGTRLLDAGCGTGEHAAELADEGADVVGVDASEKMLAEAREEHLGVDRAGSLTFSRADLTDGLPFDDGAFDAVCCQLVLSHVADLDPVYETFARVLGPGSELVIATHHPFHDYRVVERREYPHVPVGSGPDLDPTVRPDRHPPTYHETERFEVIRSAEGPVATYYRRSVGDLLGSLTDAGFDVTGIEEPVPDGKFQERYPDAYDELVSRPPSILAVRARRRAA